MKDAVIGQLFGAAAGRCSICKIDLFIEQVKIGEMAHIIAKKAAGPRGMIDYTGDLNSYENLILLCANHHTIVDGNEAGYPVERLRAIKAEHEAWVDASLKTHSKKHVDAAGLQALMRFLPFTQLLAVAERLPQTLMPQLIEASSAVEAFPLDNPQCRPFHDPVLEQHYTSFVHHLQALVHTTEGPPYDKHCYVYPDNIQGEPYLILNRDLSYPEMTALKTAIRKAVVEFNDAYLPLMQYLRGNYSEVDITAYR